MHFPHVTSNRWSITRRGWPPAVAFGPSRRVRTVVRESRLSVLRLRARFQPFLDADPIEPPITSNFEGWKFTAFEHPVNGRPMNFQQIRHFLDGEHFVHWRRPPFYAQSLPEASTMSDKVFYKLA